MARWAIAIHGGAGVDPNLPEHRQEEAKRVLARCLQVGVDALRAGSTALDVVEAVVRELETDPCFNSGRGSALTRCGTVEMESSIMDGRGRRCGAVSGVSTVKNPVSLARRVMEKSPHSYLAFDGAENFAREQEILKRLDKIDAFDSKILPDETKINHDETNQWGSTGQYQTDQGCEFADKQKEVKSDFHGYNDREAHYSFQPKSSGKSNSSSQATSVASGDASVEIVSTTLAQRVKEQGRRRNIPSKLKSHMVLLDKRSRGAAKSPPQSFKIQKSNLFDASCDLTSTHVNAAVEYIVTLSPKAAAQIVVFKSEDVTLLAKHMKCLTPGATEYQDCELINAYAEHLSTPIGPDQPARVDSHRLLYSTWRTEFLTRERDVSDNLSPQKIEAINRSVKQYFDCDMVLFPMNVNDDHWIVVAMDTKRRQIIILDSLRSLQMYKKKIEKLLNGIEAEVSVSRKHLDPYLPDVTSWPIRQIENIPKQTDGHSCGLFALKYMEHWDGTRLKIDFTQRDVCISRKKMIAELIFSHANQNEEVKEEVRKIMRKREKHRLPSL